MTALASALISAIELQKILHEPHVRVLDATYGQPPSGMGIEKAVNFDIDLVADMSAPLPHTIPTADHFAESVGKMGIGNDDLVVIYDATGIAFSAARVWWLFRLFGHDRVKVLDGGLPAWLAAGFPLAPKTAAPQPVYFKADPQPALYKSGDDIAANIDSPAFALIDARDPRRFSGEAAEPRPGMPSGHIPGSRNLFFAQLLSDDGTMLRPRSALADIVAQSGVDAARPLAVTCGSGVTACVVALALHEIGHPDAAIYDGSWSEWSQRPNAPVKQGKEP